MSMHQTSLPSSAKPAAVTRPTYPVPITPIGSRCVLMWRRRRLAAERPHRACDRQHLLVRERAQERVGHPIGPAPCPPGDELQAAAVVEELVGPAARPH